jgi:hypothetical protein
MWLIPVTALKIHLGNTVLPDEFGFMSTIEPGMIPSDYLRILESFTNPLRLGSLSRGKSYSVKLLAPNRIRD